MSNPSASEGSTPNPGSSAIATLCPACGLCCNGVLFADVELQRSDHAEALIESGLIPRKKGRKLAFPQPCHCFDGTYCGIYATRPAQCRAFECRLLKGVQAGTLTTQSALSKIEQARHKVERVRTLLHACGNTSQDWPLIRRYAQVLVKPIDLSQPGNLERFRARLLVEMGRLMAFLHRNFL